MQSREPQQQHQPALLGTSINQHQPALLGTSINQQQASSITHHHPPSTSINQHQPPPLTTICHQPALPTTFCHQPAPPTTLCHPPPSTSIIQHPYHHHPAPLSPSATLCHHPPLFAITHHPLPSTTITHHQPPSPTITSHPLPPPPTPCHPLPPPPLLPSPPPFPLSSTVPSLPPVSLIPTLSHLQPPPSFCRPSFSCFAQPDFCLAALRSALPLHPWPSASPRWKGLCVSSQLSNSQPAAIPASRCKTPGKTPREVILTPRQLKTGTAPQPLAQFPTSDPLRTGIHASYNAAPV